MTLYDIKSVLRQLTALTDGWNVDGEIPSIERDLALDKLRVLYEALLKSDVAVRPVDETVVEQVTVDINLDEVLSVGFLDASAGEELVSEEAPMQEVLPDVPSELEPVLQVSAVPQPEPVVSTLFGPDEAEGQRRHRQKQRVLMSLYDMEEQSVSVSAVSEPAVPAVEISVSVSVEGQDEEPLVIEEELVIEEVEIEENAEKDLEGMGQQGAVLGDVLNHDVETLADKLAAPHAAIAGISRIERGADLHEVIGINDRFLMVRDLFGGDIAAYNRAIEAINAFDDLDDCLIYIAENYAWNPNSDGAKLLMELIEHKLL